MWRGSRRTLNFRWWRTIAHNLIPTWLAAKSSPLSYYERQQCMVGSETLLAFPCWRWWKMLNCSRSRMLSKKARTARPSAKMNRWCDCRHSLFLIKSSNWQNFQKCLISISNLFSKMMDALVRFYCFGGGIYSLLASNVKNIVLESTKKLSTIS